MDQSKANQWIHTLLGVLHGTLHTLGDAPSHSVQELAPGVGVTEAEAAALFVPTAALSTPAELPAVAPVLAPTAPFVATMAPNGASRAPRTRVNRRAVIVVRKNAIR
jgi:hypothetical protein